MADLSVVADAVAIVYRPDLAKIWPGIAEEAITPGQTVYQTSTGTWGVADGNASGKFQLRGIALKKAGSKGQAIDILVEGYVAGFDLSSLAYDAQVFLSDTAGKLADAAGTHSVPCGRVVAIPDVPLLTKVLFFKADWINQVS